MPGLLAVIVLGPAFAAFCYYQLAMHPTKVQPKPVWAIVILVGNRPRWDHLPGRRAVG